MLSLDDGQRTLRLQSCRGKGDESVPIAHAHECRGVQPRLLEQVVCDDANHRLDSHFQTIRFTDSKDTWRGGGGQRLWNCVNRLHATLGTLGGRCHDRSCEQMRFYTAIALCCAVSSAAAVPVEKKKWLDDYSASLRDAGVAAERAYTAVWFAPQCTLPPSSRILVRESLSMERCIGQCAHADRHCLRSTCAAFLQR